MVRHELELGSATCALPRLQSLWRALDMDDSGFICAGEFGRFMRMSADHAPVDMVTQAREKQREEELARRQRESAQWKENAARKAQGNAARLAKEAAALEAALLAAQSDGGSSLPAIKGKGRSSGPVDPLREMFEWTGGASSQRHF